MERVTRIFLMQASFGLHWGRYKAKGYSTKSAQIYNFQDS